MAAQNGNDRLYSIWARPKHIIVAVDGSRFGDAALLWALSNLYTKESDVVHLVHCYVPLDTVVTGLDEGLATYVPSAKEMDDEAKEEQEVLNNAAAKCAELGVTATQVQKHLLTGNAAETIQEFANKLKADAIVVGCRGRGYVAEALLGSVSSYLAHHCKQPVVIVRSE